MYYLFCDLFMANAYVTVLRFSISIHGFERMRNVLYLNLIIQVSVRLFDPLLAIFVLVTEHCHL